MSKKVNYYSPRGRTATGEPNPVDIHVGNRIRLRRTLLGISQEQLAEALGITFQQVQKYERGMNRVGASRMWDISNILEVPVGFFYEDMAPDIKSQSPRCLKMPANANLKPLVNETEIVDPMSTQEMIELVRAFYKIPNRQAAKQMYDLMITMSKSTYSKTEK